MTGWAVWDVETLRWAREVPGGWTNPAGFGLAVAKVLDHTGEMHTFYEEDGPRLLAFLNGFDLVVGFNSYKFDCGVLAAHGDVGRIRDRTLDILLSLDQATGIPHCVSLERASTATLGRGKLLADGAEAVDLWRQNTPESRRIVEDYCELDVRLTFELWRFGATHGYVFAPRRPGRGRAPRGDGRVPISWPSPDLVAAGR